MAHMKNVVIYYSGDVKVYINQCLRNPKYQKIKKKTEQYAVRRNDVTGSGAYIGGIQWSGAWRQYVFYPEKDTQWSKGCLEGISNFLEKINKKHREKLKRKKLLIRHPHKSLS